MADIANAIVEGAVCEKCGMYIESPAPGYPRSCEACKPSFDKHDVPQKVHCPHCHKKVKRAGFKDHLHNAHQVKEQGHEE